MLTELQQQEEKRLTQVKGSSSTSSLPPLETIPVLTPLHWCGVSRPGKKKRNWENETVVCFLCSRCFPDIWSIFEVAARMLRIMLFGVASGEQEFVRLAQKGSGRGQARERRGRARVKAVCSVARVGWFLWPFLAECVSWAGFFFSSMWVDWLSIFGVCFYLFVGSLYADTNLLQFSSVMSDKF